MSFKIVGIILVALVIAATGGWLAGASGRSVIEAERNRSELRAQFADARALVLDGRVSVFLSNFGDAIQRFQNARNRIGFVQRSLRETGQVEQAGRLEIALSHLADAQHAAAMFDATRAQFAAEQALGALQAAGGGS